ncbi:OLC1v1021274C1 [Oldenlandia corymbosa var. corymbosa]|uniref:OLC1v1021274C1 n=1 Tax=Oldenlandia corymbosa var. corymbosa TaxID=529605 RepID=A0AAV1BVY1_OLDCO|nr:OLC1v1021274C1 [Oldenlandia corymbosa var. corymbosa]
MRKYGRIRSSTSREINIPAELIWEILIWIPVKDLMRFKCVSRVWFSIINDPAFAKTHRRGFQGLLLLSEVDLNYPVTKHHLHYVSLDGQPNELCNQLTVNHRKNDTMMRRTEVVNGLMCYYSFNQAFLYNIATRERLRLPRIPCIDERGHYRYYFGFDPVNKLYKLLRIGYQCNWRCKILTIGKDKSWRTIYRWRRSKNNPLMEVTGRGICFNGVLYWMVSTNGQHDQNLIAFDLAQEKFQVIPTPPGEPRQFFLPNFGSSLTLVSKRWVDARHGLVTFISHGCNDGICRDLGWIWTDELELGYPKLKANFCLSKLQGFTPNGEALIIDGEPQKGYLFDLTKRESEMIELHIPPVSCLTEVYLLCQPPSLTMSYFEENMISLKSLISSI